MEFFSLKHAAMFLRVTPERLRALIKTGQAAATRRGRGYVLELAEITRLAELEADPTYAGIDIRRELGKAQAWASVRNVGVSRMRFVNWLNKAVNDRPIAFNGTGATSFAKPAPKVWEPLGWREWVRENAQDPTWADRPWTSLDSAAQKYIIGELDRGESTVQVPQQDDPPDSRGDETPLLGRREVPRDSQTIQSLLSVHLAGL